MDQFGHHRLELPIRLSRNVVRVFERDDKRGADPPSDLLTQQRFVARREPATAHDAQGDCTRFALNNLNIANVVGVLEQVVEAHDARAFRGDDVIVATTLDGGEYRRVPPARARATRVLPHANVTNIV